MKTSLLLPSFVVSAALSAVLGGCAPEVMVDRGYAPAADDDSKAIAATEKFDSGEVATAPVKETPAAAPEKEEFPVMDASGLSAGPDSAGKDTAAVGASSYVVKKGDTLGVIGRKFGVDYRAIMAANNISDARKLRVGQKLVIPAQGSVVVPKTAEKTPDKKKTASSGSSAASSASAVTLTASGEYVVQKGDNIPRIARKLKVKASDLMKANGLDEAATRRLQIGQKLKVPGASSASAATETAKSAPVETTASSATASAATETAKSAPAEAASSVSISDTTTASSASAAADAGAVSDAVPKMIEEDTTAAAFAARHNTTVEILKKCNPDDFPADGMLKKGTIIFVPAK